MTSASAKLESHQRQRLNARYHTVNASCKHKQPQFSAVDNRTARTRSREASVFRGIFELIAPALVSPHFSTNENTALQDDPIRFPAAKKRLFFSAEHFPFFDATRHSVIPPTSHHQPSSSQPVPSVAARSSTACKACGQEPRSRRWSNRHSAAWLKKEVQDTETRESPILCCKEGYREV